MFCNDDDDDDDDDEWSVGSVWCVAVLLLGLVLRCSAAEGEDLAINTIVVCLPVQ